MRKIYKFFRFILSSIGNFIMSEEKLAKEMSEFKKDIKNVIALEKDIEFCKNSTYEKYIIDPLIFFTKMYYGSIELLLLVILSLSFFTKLNLLLSIVISILAPLVLLFLSYRIYYFFNHVIK